MGLAIREKIIILDFGGQYNQLIARRIREAGVYCEILNYAAPIESWRDEGLKGVILTGGPNSVYGENAPRLGREVFELGVPVLGICYGMQLINYLFGGKVESAEVGEYGHTMLYTEDALLFAGVGRETAVFMNHNDRVSVPPEGFTVDARTDHCPVAAFSDVSRGIYGVQFHPEVRHSVEGVKMLRNFAFGVCGCAGDYRAEDMIEHMVQDIRTAVGEGKVVAGLSGGVDSSVACALAGRALRRDQLTCVFVDHGLLRLNEAEQVIRTYRDNLGLNVVHVDASERFLEALKGVTEPERKRKIIGELFVRVFEEEARKTGADFLLQGTIYPDKIESGMGGSATIKSHHNVGGLPKDSLFKKDHIIEPLSLLFKDEVRAVGEGLGIPHDMVWRQPFPGPGLAVRVIGDITREKLDLLRACDAIYLEELKSAGLSEAIWQSFAVLTGVRTVGCMGDDRTYGYCVGLRAVTSDDAMTVEAAEIPYPVLKRCVSRIIGEVPGVNRVVYDITGKPPGTIEWE
ncbi:MAG: glutamine-hydrolyzing GMP synthase [Clostridia bacterium]|nr:glutamine-hydrolyzing GMP synthase [Clostridia bacterium]